KISLGMERESGHRALHSTEGIYSAWIQLPAVAPLFFHSPSLNNARWLTELLGTARGCGLPANTALRFTTSNARVSERYLAKNKKGGRKSSRLHLVVQQTLL